MVSYALSTQLLPRLSLNLEMLPTFLPHIMSQGETLPPIWRLPCMFLWHGHLSFPSRPPRHLTLPTHQTVLYLFVHYLPPVQLVVFSPLMWNLGPFYMELLLLGSGPRVVPHLFPHRKPLCWVLDHSEFNTNINMCRKIQVIKVLDHS